MPGPRFQKYNSGEKNPCPYGPLLAYNKKIQGQILLRLR